MFGINLDNKVLNNIAEFKQYINSHIVPPKAVYSFVVVVQVLIVCTSLIFAIVVLHFSLNFPNIL